MKQKTRILIYIIIAIAVVIMGTLTILKNHQAYSPATVQEHIDLGRIYLTELSYEKASLEFTEAIEFEPLNSDAYLGLAEAYVGMCDTEKAIDVLEEGYDKTGDERLKDMLEELQPPEETMVTTAVTTEETTTVSTVAMAVVPDLQGLTEEEAIAACETAGLNYSVSYNYSDAVEKGYVIGQTIPVNASVAEGIIVPFTVSEGGITTVATTTANTERLTETSNTSIISTTMLEAITISEPVENEKIYGNNGNLLYEKVKSDTGYELWWYYSIEKTKKPVIHIVEKYNNKNDLQYSTVYNTSGEKYIEGNTTDNENGYSIIVIDKNKWSTEYKINKTRNIYEYITNMGSYIHEYYYDSKYEYVEKTREYAIESDDVVFEKYYESKKDYEKQYLKKEIVYLNDNPLTITEYKINSNDKARMEQHYGTNGELFSVNEYDSNDVMRKSISYTNGSPLEFDYDENGNLILNFK